jgi:hypothetical protein
MDGRHSGLRAVRQHINGLVSDGVPQWPVDGFSFHTWVCVENDLPPGVAPAEPGQCVVDRSPGTASGSPHTAHLLSVWDDSGRGIDLYLDRFEVVYTCRHHKADAQTMRTGIVLTRGQWHSISLGHVGRTGLNSLLGRHTEVRVLVDGSSLARGVLRYPHFKTGSTADVVVGTSRVVGVPHPRGDDSSRQGTPVGLGAGGAGRGGAGRGTPSSSAAAAGPSLYAVQRVSTLRGRVGSVFLFQVALSVAQVRSLASPPLRSSLLPPHTHTHPLLLR